MILIVDTLSLMLIKIHLMLNNHCLYTCLYKCLCNFSFRLCYNKCNFHTFMIEIKPNLKVQN